MKTTIHAKKLLMPFGWAEDCVITAEDGRISGAARGTDAGLEAEFVTPGLIDNHIHGGDGFDILKADREKFEKWTLALARAGVAGVMACPYGGREEIRGALAAAKEFMELQRSGRAGGALVLGVHLEGPFISRNRLGAMREEIVLAPTVENFKSLTEGYEDLIREVTLAPEEPGADELIPYLRARGIRVQAGHTDCTYEKAQQSFALGVGAVTHFFNAARPIRHRDPGILTAALLDDNVVCEMIGDLVHLHPGALKLIYKCKGRDRIMLISDAVSTTHLPDGVYREGGVNVVVSGGVSRVEESGSLNGGGCYISRTVRNMESIGIPFEDAAVMAGVTPARWLGLDSWKLRPGDPVLLTGWSGSHFPLFTVVGKNVYRGEENG